VTNEDKVFYGMLSKGKELKVVIQSWTEHVEAAMHFHSIMESYFHNVDHVHVEGMDFATCLLSWFCTIRHALSTCNVEIFPC
jgi:hypothetical protein